MKLLPCASPNCGPLGAALPPSVRYAQGEPYLAASHVTPYKCARCKRTYEMTVAEFNTLPRLTAADFATLASRYGAPHVKDLPTRDLVGQGFSKEQATQLFDTGLAVDAFNEPVRERA